VLTDNGYKNIEDVKVDDFVFSQDVNTGIQAYKPVLDVVVTRPNVLYHINYAPHHQLISKPSRSADFTDCFEDDTESNDKDDEDEPAKPYEVICTGGHPFYVYDRKEFVSAEYLQKGNMLLLASGEPAEIVSIEKEQSVPGENFITYNLSVAEFGTYFAGTEGILVHNAGRNPCEKVFSIYKHLRGPKRNKTIHEAFRIMEDKLPKNIPSKTMALAIDEVLDKEVFPSIPHKIWTKGKFTSSGENIHDHYMKHIVNKRLKPLIEQEFPDIDNVITYTERAVNFSNHNQPTGAIQIGYRIRAGAKEKVVYDDVNKHFLVKIMEGSKAGEIKTFFRCTPEELAKRGYTNADDYFLDEIEELLD